MNALDICLIAIGLLGCVTTTIGLILSAIFCVDCYYYDKWENEKVEKIYYIIMPIGTFFIIVATFLAFVKVS